MVWKYAIVSTAVANQGKIHSIINIKLYVLVVTLSTQGNGKLLQQLKSSFERAINWNKYQSKVWIERPKQYLHYLIDPRFQFKDNAHWTIYNPYFFQLKK